MASQRRIEANRRNAQKSTGPKTTEGKAASAQNAVRHGLSARTVVLKLEDPEAYDALRSSLIESYAPANAHELMLVEGVAAAYWRTIRSRAMEKDILDSKPNEVLAIFESRFQTYFRYDAAISRDYYRALAALDKAQERRRSEEARIAKTKPIAPPPVAPEDSRETAPAHPRPFLVVQIEQPEPVDAAPDPLAPPPQPQLSPAPTLL